MLPLKVAQLQEASQMLTDILNMRSQQSGEQHVSVGEVACVLTLLYLCLKDLDNAKQSFLGAQILSSRQAGTSKFSPLLSTTQTALKKVVA